MGTFVLIRPTQTFYERINSGLVDVLAGWCSRLPRYLAVRIVSLSALTAFLSAFMNNVGAVSLIMPVAIKVSNRTKHPPSLFLMPLAFNYPRKIPSSVPTMRAIPDSAWERRINVNTAITPITSPTVEKLSAMDYPFSVSPNPPNDGLGDSP